MEYIREDKLGPASRVMNKRKGVPSSIFSEAFAVPVSSEYGTYKTVKARFWSWLAGKSPQNVLSCSLFARKRYLVPRRARIKAHIPLYHSTLGLRIIKKKKMCRGGTSGAEGREATSQKCAAVPRRARI